MNTNFLTIIAATEQDRRDLFLTTANRLGTPLQNVEKDFWICFVLDLLFNARNAHEPRLLFKGGTSLSKAYGLISRFSEDLDITVFREDLGQNIEIESLEKLSGKQKRKRLDVIKQACQHYIKNELKDRLNQQLLELLEQANIKPIDNPVIIDLDDPDEQTLLVRYPSVNTEVNDYIKQAIKIEAGAKSALEPHQLVSIQPYVADDFTFSDLTTNNIVTIKSERTFWDKIVILHGIRRWYDNRKHVRKQGHRISRHYYDVYKLLNSSVGQDAKTNSSLALDCMRHALMFFNSADLDLASAKPGTFAIMPAIEMQEVLKQDYKAMTGMIFGEVPDFDDVLQKISELEKDINKHDN